MSRHPFDLLMELSPQDVRLDCAALHLARDAYPHIELRPYLQKMDDMAEAVAAEKPGLSATLRYEAMREVLVERFEMCGNQDDYYDPDNSYLNQVLQRGLGIPITLGIIWIEVGRRLKWPVTGASFPGHFLVRFDDPERYLMVDPFHGGRALSLVECKSLLKQQFEGKIAFNPAMLKPVATPMILVRLLNNLRAIYMVNQDWPKLAQVLTRLAAVEPQNGRHIEELADLYCRLGQFREAHEQLAAFLQRVPDADDRIVKRAIQRLEAAQAALN